jgi:methyl-accepting chemotaxis protein
MKLFKNLKLSQRLWFLTFLTILCLAGFGFYSFSTMDRVKVNGALYKKIVLGKDLIADVLPPPEYLIESYLVTSQMLSEKDPAKIDELINKSKQLEEDYNVRHKYWKDNLDEGDIKQMMIVDSYEPAEEFFQIRDNQFIPLIKNGNIQQAELLYNSTLKDYYEKHRASIDKVVELSTAANSKFESETNEFIESRFTIMIVIIVVLTVFVFFSFFSAIKAIKNPIQKLIKIVNKLAEGIESLSQSSIEISNGNTSVMLNNEIINVDIDTKDEIGNLADSVKKIVKSREELNNSFSILSATTNELLIETTALTNSAIEGNLQFRASTNKFKGSYKEIIKGINETLDSVIAPIKEGVTVLEKMA